MVPAAMSLPVPSPPSQQCQGKHIPTGTQHININICFVVFFAFFFFFFSLSIHKTFQYKEIVFVKKFKGKKLTSVLRFLFPKATT